MTETLSKEEFQALYLKIVQDFKYKKLEIDKKLDEIVNRKITKIDFDNQKQIKLSAGKKKHILIKIK